MKIHKKIIITLAVLIFFASGAAIGINMIPVDSDKPDASRQITAEPDIPSIEINGNGIRKHAEKWTSFVQDCKNGQPTSIQLDYDYPGQTPHGDGTPGAAPDIINLEFDGENYLCFEKTYKYLLELSGHTPNATKSTTYVILSNEQYSFRDVSNSIYSSDSNNQIPYMLLFTR